METKKKAVDLANMANDNGGKPVRVRPEMNASMLLALAGFDPDVIPGRQRMQAVWLAWAWKDGLFEVEHLAEALEMSETEVSALTRRMRTAARQGAIVG